jgi:hypothetical protein
MAENGFSNIYDNSIYHLLRLYLVPPMAVGLVHIQWNWLLVPKQRDRLFPS